MRMGRENRKWPENNQVWRRNGYAFGASISEFLASLSKISCLSNVMLMAHNCSPRYLLYGLCFLSKDWMWDLCRKPCTHLQDDCLRSGHGLWPWNGAKPIRPYVDQACDLDLISTVVGSARLTSPRWLSLMLYFVYKDPKAHSGQSKCLNWALFNVWFDANKLGVFSFFLEFFWENGKLYSRLVEIQYLFRAVPSPLFSYERSYKVPYPDLTCFGKFNKPLWWKQGIAQRPLDLVWYLLLIPWGPSSDTHVDSLRNCRNFCSVLCTEKKL